MTPAERVALAALVLALLFVLAELVATFRGPTRKR
jgi:hypothetical protein